MRARAGIPDRLRLLGMELAPLDDALYRDAAAEIVRHIPVVPSGTQFPFWTSSWASYIWHERPASRFRMENHRSLDLTRAQYDPNDVLIDAHLTEHAWPDVFLNITWRARRDGVWRHDETRCRFSLAAREMRVLWESLEARG